MLRGVSTLQWKVRNVEVRRRPALLAGELAYEQPPHHGAWQWKYSFEFHATSARKASMMQKNGAAARPIRIRSSRPSPSYLRVVEVVMDRGALEIVVLRRANRPMPRAHQALDINVSQVVRDLLVAMVGRG